MDETLFDDLPVATIVVPLAEAKYAILIDTMNLMWRSAGQRELMTLKTSAGRPSGHVYGFYKQLLSIWSKFGEPNETSLIFGFDLSGSKSARQKLYPEYKANRDRDPDDIVDLFGLTLGEVTADIEFLISCLPHHSIASSKYECDDLLAAVVQKTSSTHHYVISNDRDMWALRGDYRNVDIVASKGSVVDHNILADYYEGVTEFSHIRPYKALFGDKSDNIPTLLPRIRRKVITEEVLPFYDRKNPISSLMTFLRKCSSSGVQRLLEDPAFEENLRINFDIVNFLPISDKDYEKSLLRFDEGNKDRLIEMFERFECRSLTSNIPWW